MLPTNTSGSRQHSRILELVLSAAPITLPCAVFLYINGVLLFSLRSKSMFGETSRYILLFNLLLADTMQMVLSQLLYFLSIRRLSYPVCGVLIMLAYLTNIISPLTLVVMSLERYVAVCYPLRHSAVVTVKNTAVALAVVWGVGSLNILTWVILSLQFPFEKLQTLQMTGFCSAPALFLSPLSELFFKSYTFFMFGLSTVVVVGAYVGVMIAAGSASVDKTSAARARNTLLLHLFQLGPSLLSTTYIPLVQVITALMDRVEALRVRVVFYLFFVVMPRFLSTLVYGIRDQALRPVFMQHLGCRMKPSDLRHKTHVSTWPK